MSRAHVLVLVVAVGGCAAGTSSGTDPGGGGLPDPGGSGSDGDPGTGSGSDPGTGTGSGSGSGTIAQPTYPTQHPRIYIEANRAHLKASLAAQTPAATRFKTIVDNWVGGADYWGFRAWEAALMGQLTGGSQYCAKAIATVDAQVSAAEAAIVGGSAPVVAGDSYLDVGPMIGDVALVYDWCFDDVTATQKTRWLAYANQAVWNVWHPAEATWGAWSGWATDDPSDNYYYSFLKATMLLGLAEKGEDPQGDTWIKQFRETKVLGELVPTFNSDLVGGGSREGTGYGTAMGNLWFLYDMWHATTGEQIASRTPHTRASMLSFMHQVVPTLDRFAPTGDQSRDSTASMFDYQRSYLQELVSLYPSDPAAGPAQTLLAHCSVPTMENAFMAFGDFLYDNANVAQSSMSALGTAYYAPGIGELYARSGWDTHATWINLIAGPYTQSHAHQDQGSLLIYKDGWLAYDSVINSKSGLRQETTAHSVVRIDQNGAPVHQVADTISKLVALHRGNGWLHAAADVTPAYDGAAAVSKVQRELVYLEPDVIVVYDRVASAAGTDQTWQLATPVRPTVSGASATISGAHALHVQRLAPSGATSSVFDFTSDPSGDYTGGFRLDEHAPGGDQRYLHVLSIDGAVSSATATGDSAVTVTLSNGKTATVTFSRNAVGGTLTYGGTTVTLSQSIDALPE